MQEKRADERVFGSVKGSFESNGLVMPQLNYIGFGKHGNKDLNINSSFPGKINTFSKSRKNKLFSPII